MVHAWHCLIPREAELSSRINNREEDGHLQDWLEEEHDLRDTQDRQDGQDEEHAQDGQDTTEDANAIAVDPSWRANMLIQVILHAGHASPTHAFVYLDRYVKLQLALFFCSSLYQQSDSSTELQLVMVRLPVPAYFRCFRYHDYLQSLSGNEASGEANQVCPGSSASIILGDVMETEIPFTMHVKLIGFWIVDKMWVFCSSWLNRKLDNTNQVWLVLSCGRWCSVGVSIPPSIQVLRR